MAMASSRALILLRYIIVICMRKVALWEENR